MGEGAGFAGFVPVELVGGIGLVLDLGEFGNGSLHAEGHLELLDPGVGFGIPDLGMGQFVELPETVELASSDVGWYAGGIVDEEDGIAGGAEGDAGVFAGEVATGPETTGDGLELFLVGGLGDEDDEGGEVGVEGAESVGDPGAEAGPAADHVAGLHGGDGGFVVDGLGVHGADEGDVIGATRGPREEFGDPHSVPAMLGEAVF